MKEEFKEILDTAVRADNFNINNCINFEEFLDTAELNAYRSINEQLNNTNICRALRKSLIRNSFLIELVNGEATSTKYQTHWCPDLTGDVRYASFDECVKIFSKLLNKTANLSSDEFAVLAEFFTSKNSGVPFEIPVDYIESSANSIHTENNIELYLGDDERKGIAIRNLMLDPDTNPDYEIFKRILAKKIKIKTYLTDRSLTGLCKTDREKRWETHPSSVQFALRRECMKIEAKLLLQVAAFKGCNKVLVKNLQEKGLLSSNFDCYRCPITGDVITYDSIVDTIENPVHGKSGVQVGHLYPLKADVEESSHGHTADNIGWISEDGNRIQGSLSLNEVDELLKRIYKNRPELRS